MKSRHLLLLPFLLIAACTSKYPYPPQYVSSYEVSPRSIPIPPARHSAEYNQEVDSIVAIQSKLTPEEIKLIKHQDQISPDKMVVPVLGAQYSKDNYPVMYDFLNKVASDSWRIGDDARDYWRSPRPWYTERRVKLYVEPIYTYGYPSGHTTTFGTWAYVLSDLFPAKRDAFFTQAWGAGANRIKGGAHFPHDIAGGKRMAEAVYDAMAREPEYQRDLAAVKAELRAGGAAKHAQPCRAGMKHCNAGAR